MALNWNEIKERAIRFSKEWEGTSNEEADAKPFLVDFFGVFGINNRRFSSFEYRVKKLNDKDGYIDLLWKGVILVEMKSKGKNLDKAYQQAKAYLHGLQDYELPKAILVSDFEYFRLYDLEETEDGKAPEDNYVLFTLKDLVKNVKYFGFMMGYNKKVYKEQDPANRKAAELMGKLHDRLEEIGYTGHSLEVYLVRILFCLFAEDTDIFEKQQLQDYIEQRTNPDGSDLAAKLQELFQVLNTPKEKRFKNIDEQLNEFPYINGRLFEELLPTASFDGNMRKELLNCCYFDWSRISPAIFGSMFQSVMNPTERRNLGAHYTSEANILKVIKPLFLDDLWAEFESIKHDFNSLITFHNKISTLQFLDPACGCGNFLIITYRELRILEFHVLSTLDKVNLRVNQMQFINISLFFKVNVDQFYGIEYEEFPARIAEVAMWLIDHQMNLFCSIETGKPLLRIPLVKSAMIKNADALETDWNSLLVPKPPIEISAEEADIIIRVQEPTVKYGKVNLKVEHYKIVDEFAEIKADTKFDYIIGNPPFIGSKIMKQAQRNQITRQFYNIEGSGVLDYVTGWYIKAAKYIQGTQTKVAFVSTNSIVQGEQTAILWGYLMKKYGIKIHFAHRTFKWSNEAKGNAAVYCVIIGFANFDTDNKRIFDYENIKGDAHEVKAKNINPYLVDARDVLIEKRSNPICNVPKMSFGNMPLDGGHLLLSDEEKEEFLRKEPKAEKFILPLISAHEFLNNKKRWCLWLVGEDPENIKRNYPEVSKRVHAVYKFRLDSVAPSTQKFAATPTLFRDRNRPATFIVVPRVSSETRRYIPMGFFDENSIVSDTCMAIPEGTKYHFGILMSKMHLAWVKTVCGRLKSDFRYSKDIVYNNYPFPENPSDKQIKAIETAVEKVLAARLLYPKSSLGALYDELFMPIELVKAHNALDKAVDLAYRPQPFTSEANRMELLFGLYEKYTADLFTKEKPKKGKKK